MATPNKTVALILVLVAALGVGVWLINRQPAPPAAPQYALRLPETLDLPDFQLLDQDGHPLDNDWFNGRWTMVFFGFTHCPDICPVTLSMLSAARVRLSKQRPDQQLPDILLISVDPDRDSPASLKQYVAHFGEGVSGATGSLQELRKLATTLGVYFEREGGEGNEPDMDYNVAHSAHVIIIDDHGNYSAVFGPPHSIDAFVTDMPLLMTPR